MSDEIAESPKPKRGRPAGTKTRKRHDPTQAPIDGDYAPLSIVGREPGWTYVALSASDRDRRGHRYEVVRWSEKCAHPPYAEFREELRGQEVKVNRELTLMRIPTARDEARKNSERSAHRAASQGIAANEAAAGFTPSARSIVTHNNIPVHQSY